MDEPGFRGNDARGRGGYRLITCVIKMNVGETVDEARRISVDKDVNLMGFMVC